MPAFVDGAFASWVINSLWGRSCKIVQSAQTFQHLHGRSASQKVRLLVAIKNRGSDIIWLFFFRAQSMLAVVSQRLPLV